jgi:dCTP deaminase
MVLSDRTIRRLIEEGRIGIEPFDDVLVQPSSIDVRIDRLFRVFKSSR